MARTPLRKALENTRLLKEYASWIYCTVCNNTVAYLCYTHYDLFDFAYTCRCGSQGRVLIEFPHENEAVRKSAAPLQSAKNRLCCPQDGSPLLTLVEKNLAKAEFRIVCNVCRSEYSQG